MTLIEEINNFVVDIVSKFLYLFCLIFFWPLVVVISDGNNIHKWFEPIFGPSEEK